MLNKRFKIAKCKTSLKLATSRIKLMRNKKGVQINQMKKELAQLLESGQDRTARIRVEHVIREEKMVAAYDLIDIYCELIVARLPIIESQKTCPIDLKEAVTSVIFAAPRCSDIPELVDAKKHLTAKYGKEFVSAAIELHPDCGVSRMLIEKLSAVAPDVQTKIKVLTAVAKEYNINWDPTSFEEKESKPPDDFLNGPANFEQVSTTSVDSPEIQTSNVQNVHSYEGNQNVHSDFAQQNKRFTVDSQNITVADTGGFQTSFASNTHGDMRSSGMATGMINMRQSFNSNSNDSWNMEFKDATSAAQAAAESAERASIAARAAAQLSSQDKITRQYSTESRDTHFRNDTPQVYKDSYSFNNISFNDRKPKTQNQQTGAFENDISPKATKRSESLRSRNDPVDESSVNHFHPEDGYFETREERTSLNRESKARFTSSVNESFKSHSSRSHSRTIGEQDDVLTFDQQNIFRETSKTSSYDDAPKDDETDSDDDGPRFDTGFEYDEIKAKSFFPSPDRESSIPPEKTHISSQGPSPSPKKSTGNSTQVNSAKSVDYSVKSDHSDGPDSESEEEMGKSSSNKAKKFTSPLKHNLFSTHPEPAYVDTSPKVNSTKSRIELNDLVESEGESESGTGKSSFNETKKFTSPRKHNLFSTYPEPAYVETSPKVNFTKSRIELNDLVETGSSFHNRNNNIDSLNQSDDLDTEKDLKFGNLTGGRRNKSGYKYPPYTKSASPSSKQSVEENPINYEPISNLSSFNSRASRLEKKPSVSISSSESESDDYSVKFSVKRSSKKSQFTPLDSFFNNDGTDSVEEVLPVRKQTSTSKVYSSSGLSRRTKGQVDPVSKTVLSNPSPSEILKKNPDTNRESLEMSSSSAERKSNTRSNITKSPPEPRPGPARCKQEPSGTTPEPKISEPPTNPPKKIVESGKTEAPKTSNLSSETKLEANNVKKPSHVHPKLPEYDSLAARIQALNKMNHQ